MKSRRRISIALLIAASVFLCLLASCGIPTYLVPTVNAQNTSSSANSTTFNVSYKGDSVGDYGKVGLLLVYYLDSGEKIDTNDSSKIRSTFTSKFKVSTNDGIVVSVDTDSKLYDFTNVKGETGNVYAFEVNGRRVEAPVYTLEMSTDGDFSSTIKLDFISENEISMTVDGEIQSISLSLSDASPVTVGSNYIQVFAAISVQSSQYSNLYWSSLYHVGCISTN